MAYKKVMIVDDDKEFLEELNEILELSGYETITASNTNNVLDIACTLKPDVILLDLKMQGKSGFQLAKEIEAIPDLSHVPIIAMSGYFKHDYNSLLNMCGIRSCLRKPFSPLDVIARIEEVSPGVR